MSEPTDQEIAESNGIIESYTTAPVNRAKTFSASNAARFMQCHASANLELAIPGYTAPVVDPMKGAKGRGTSMHAVLEQVVNEFNANEMLAVAHALMYVADLRKKRRFQVLTEASTVAEWLPSKPTTTVDLVLYVADEIHVVDYKMGRIEVQAKDNKQLLFYALCFAYLAPKAKGVWLHIVQPLIGNMDSVFVDTTELAQFMAAAIKADEAITAGDTTFGPSDSCTFCPANPHSRGEKGKPLCPAMMQLLYPPKYDEAEILDL